MRLRGPLKQLAGGGEHEIAGATVKELLQTLEQAQPSLDGWILDERDRIRRHINVFVNGELGGQDTRVDADDLVEVIPALSGGCR